MAPSLAELNPFTLARRKREASEAQRQSGLARQEALTRLQQRPPNVAQQVAHGRVLAREQSARRPQSLVETLTQAQEQLQRLRGLPATDLEAFPLVNEAQRHGECLGLAAWKLPLAVADQPTWHTAGGLPHAVQQLRAGTLSQPDKGLTRARPK